MKPRYIPFLNFIDACRLEKRRQHNERIPNMNPRKNPRNRSNIVPCVGYPGASAFC